MKHDFTVPFVSTKNLASSHSTGSEHTAKKKQNLAASAACLNNKERNLSNLAKQFPQLIAYQDGRRISCKNNSQLILACYKLRHDHYVLQKKWVTENPENAGLEVDRYDPYALHLAVFEENEVLAYLRVLPYQAGIGFMLNRDFACLLNLHELDTPFLDGTVEISRLVCRSDALCTYRERESHPLELLLRLLYHESKVRGFNRFYIVVEEAWLRPFARRFGLPFRTLGMPYTFPDGTRTVAAVATREELEAGMKQHSAAKYEWYQRIDDEGIGQDTE